MVKVRGELSRLFSLWFECWCEEGVLWFIFFFVWLWVGWVVVFRFLWLFRFLGCEVVVLDLGFLSECGC